MIAAGITYEITKACIKGQIDDVKGSCPRKTSKNYYKVRDTLPCFHFDGGTISISRGYSFMISMGKIESSE